MTNEEATIENIRTQLIARGWTITEDIQHDKTFEPKNNCHVELIHEDGTRKAWGYYERLYCWTEAFEKITGQPWQMAVVRGDQPRAP